MTIEIEVPQMFIDAGVKAGMTEEEVGKSIKEEIGMGLLGEDGFEEFEENLRYIIDHRLSDKND